jgi:hypothetical protein
MEKPTTQSVAVRAAGTTEQAAASGAFLNDRPGESPILRPARFKIVVRRETLEAILNPSVEANWRK